MYKSLKGIFIQSKNFNLTYICKKILIYNFYNLIEYISYVYIPRCDSSCLLDTFLFTADFSRWLVKPSLYISLPILMEMAIWNHIISLTHGGGLISTII